MKSILLTLLFVAITTVSFSQEVSYGVRGGVNISNLDFDPDATFSNQHRNGFAFGGFIAGVTSTEEAAAMALLELKNSYMI